MHGVMGRAPTVEPRAPHTIRHGAFSSQASLGVPLTRSLFSLLFHLPPLPLALPLLLIFPPPLLHLPLPCFYFPLTFPIFSPLSSPPFQEQSSQFSYLMLAAPPASLISAPADPSHPPVGLSRHLPLKAGLSLKEGFHCSC